jgi:hypothetical protein
MHPSTAHIVPAGVLFVVGMALLVASMAYAITIWQTRLHTPKDACDLVILEAVGFSLIAVSSALIEVALVRPGWPLYAVLEPWYLSQTGIPAIALAFILTACAMLVVRAYRMSPELCWARRP